jgi:Bacterial Ig domain/Glucodextranase, domain B
MRSWPALLSLVALGCSSVADAAFTVTPPTITFVAPDRETRYVAPAAPVFYVTARPSSGDPTIVPPTSVARVEFFDGDILLGSLTEANAEVIGISSSYAFVWRNPALGMHLIHARVTDTAGYSASTLDAVGEQPRIPLSVAITPATTAPQVVLSTPVTGQTFTSAASVALSAAATSSAASIRRVEFLVGNSVVAVASSPPFNAQWNNPPVGDFAVVAAAYDDRGSVSASSAAYVRVVESRAPVVVLTAPAAGSSSPSGAPIVLSAEALAPDGGIGRVDFFSGTTLLGSGTTAPYSYSLSNPQAGPLSLSAKAYDLQGRGTVSAPVLVTVASIALPTVALTAPPSGATYFAPGTIRLSADASEIGGAIERVEFIANAVVVGTVLTAPYNANWGAVPEGSYALSAKATDTLGISAVSSSVTVTVLNGAAPSVSVTSPQNGAQYSLGQPVPVTASAAMPGKIIDRVEFYSDGVLLGSVPRTSLSGALTATFTWNAASAGGHALSAKVIASDGASATSPVVNIAVSDLAIILTEPFSGQVYQVPGDIRITANPTGTSGTIARVDFYGDGVLLGSVAVAPYSILWSGVGAGPHTVTGTVRDSTGLSASSSPRTITVVSAPTVAIDAGIDGSTVADDNVSISGTLQAPLNSALMINGQAAALDRNGRFSIDNVMLQPGSNTLTLTLVGQDGDPVTKTITVNRNGIAPFEVKLDRAQGLAPLDINVNISNRANVPFQRIEVDTNDDGTPETTLTGLTDNEARLSITYQNPGRYKIRVTVFDADNNVIYIARRSILAIDPRDLGNLANQVFSGMLDRLRTGNITGAMTAITDTVQQKYQSVFTKLGSSLPAFLNENFGSFRTIFVTEEFADITWARTKQDGDYGYHILLIRDGDGLWRIDDM